MICRGILFLFCMSPILVARQCPATPYTSKEYGYTIDIPDSWKVIPPHVLDEMLPNKTNGNYKSIYDIGFQEKDSKAQFAFPRVVVAIIPYSSFGLSRQPTEKEIRLIAKSLSGASTSEYQDTIDTLQPALKSDTSNRIVDVEKPEIDLLDHKVSWSFQLQFHDEIRVCETSLLFTNKNCICGVHWYRETNRDDLKLGTHTINSLRPTESNEYHAPPSGEREGPLSFSALIDAATRIFFKVFFMVLIAAGLGFIASIVRSAFNSDKSCSQGKTEKNVLDHNEEKASFNVDDENKDAQAICRSCGSKFKAPLDAIGKRTKCLKCGTQILVKPRIPKDRI